MYPKMDKPEVKINKLMKFLVHDEINFKKVINNVLKTKYEVIKVILKMTYSGSASACLSVVSQTAI